MRNSKKALLILLGFVPLFASQVSCTKSSTCNGSGMGTLKMTNASLNTVQRCMVDGINYGTIDPGSYKKITLAAGSHSFQFVGLNGGAGCSEASVIIVECEESGYSCTN